MIKAKSSLFALGSALLLVVSSFLLNGCSSSDNGSAANAVQENSGSNSGKKSDDLEEKWIAACEKDYQSSECYKANEADLIEEDFFSLFTRIDPYANPEKSAECTTDPKGVSCQATRLLSDAYPKDLICQKVPGIGPSFYCLAEVVIKNISKNPVDDYFTATLTDDEGTVFANDVEGTLTTGYVDTEYTKNTKIELNPGQIKIVHWGFSIPDINRVFRSISVVSRGDVLANGVPLCKKNSGDQLKLNEGDEIAIYEDASLLNSCKFVHGKNYSAEFKNRLSGS
ncbi:MAG: hypothetical protein WCJ91_01150 [Actinomycetes bacterium]